MSEPEFETIRYETPAPGVARVVLARVEQRNAQDKRMLYELNDAFDRAARDNAVKVIVLSADGPHFSSGHDLRDRSSVVGPSAGNNAACPAGTTSSWPVARGAGRTTDASQEET